MRSMALLEGTYGASSRPRRSRTGQEVIGSRPYYPGDPLRHIHWRNTARLAKLAVKELEDTAEEALTVVFDVSKAFGTGRDTTLEYAIKLAATVGLHALGSGRSIRVEASNLQGEWLDAEPFLKALALLEPTDAPPLAALLARVSGGSAALAIVPAAAGQGIATLEGGPFPGVAAVVLGGFTDFDDPTGAAARLQRNGVPTVVGRRGALSEAVLEMEGLGGAGSKRRP